MSQIRTITTVADALRLLDDFDKLEAKYADLQAVLDEKERFINAQEEELDEKDECLTKLRGVLKERQEQCCCPGRSLTIDLRCTLCRLTDTFLTRTPQAEEEK